MKTDRREPCGNCPFRKDAPLGHWDIREYLLLYRMQKTEEDPRNFSNGFGCHKGRKLEKEEQQLCVGWLMNQREQGVPSIHLRLRLARDPTGELREQLDEATCDAELYETVTELVCANLEARDKWSDELQGSIDQILPHIK